MNKIKQYRLKNQLKQEEMAEKLNISINGYRNYENGLRKLPLDVLIRFLQLRNETFDSEIIEVLKDLCQ